MSEEVVNAAVWLIPGLPLLAAVVLALSGAAWFRAHSHRVCVGALALAFVLAAGVLLVRAGLVSGGSAEATSTGFEWIRAGGFEASISLRADALTALMLATVTFVGLLVAIYSIGYMHGERGYPRYFAELALFVFSMCLLVLADNFLVLYAAWELVGLCSYLLIGFWYERPAAAAAARKAFIVNRVGDFGLLMGILLIWTTFGTLSFDGVIGNGAALERLALEQPGLLTLIGLLLFAGAMGKSAQFPLHVWLPDAMEGPTPVSALIHAATMVTAGVYLVARTMPLFAHAPEAQLVVACVGALTALFAAVVAIGQHDLKRVLAWSTVSQLGLMFVALGAPAADAGLAGAAATAAMFHLFTHAFFKALLFLGAGSIMHAMGNVTDLRRFGGLRKLLPRTHITFLCGAAALAGVPLLSGFWSKDEIIAVVSQAGHGEAFSGVFQVVLGAALLTSALTAYYSCRVYLRTFWGATVVPPEAGHHAHESPRVMTVPLVILAVLAVQVGITFGPTALFSEYLQRTPTMPPAETHGIHWDVIAWSTAAAALGICAALFAGTRVRQPGREPRPAPTGLAGVLENRFYIDEILSGMVVRPLRMLGRGMLVFDRHGIDAAIDDVAAMPGLVGRLLRPLQNGLVQSYALLMLAGLALALFATLVSG